MELSKTEKKYLRNKHNGGLNNEKGNKYENYFIVYQICHYLSQMNDLENIFFSTQTEDFIDDLLINENDNFIYHQLKNTNKLSWGKHDKMKSLANDFYLQRKKTFNNKNKCYLRLVISNNKLTDKLNKSKPKDLKKILDVLYFEYYEDLSSIIKKNKIFRDSLCDIMRIDNPETDKLESLASSIYGAWGESNCKGVSINQILEKIKRNQVSFISFGENLDISDELDVILSSIEGFRFIIENNYIKWTYRNTDKGIILFEIGSEEFIQIEQQILREVPSNFTNLEEIITV